MPASTPKTAQALLPPPRRKPRADGVLRNLDADKRAAICAWLLDHSQGEVQELIAKTYGLAVGKNAVSRFYQAEVAPMRFRESAASAAAMRTLMESQPGAFAEATVKAVTQRVFDLASDPESPAADVATFAAILRDTRAQQLKERELSLREEQGAERLRQQEAAHQLALTKFRFDAAKAVLANTEPLRALVNDTSLDDDARLARVQTLLWGDAPNVGQASLPVSPTPKGGAQ